MTDLRDIDWSHFLNIANVYPLVNIFNKTILNICNNHAPVTTARITKAPAAWFTDNLKRSVKLKHKALDKSGTKLIV